MPDEREEVDLEFDQWFNREQPLEQVARAQGPRMSRDQYAAIRSAIKSAYVMGTLNGAQKEVAREFDPSA